MSNERRSVEPDLIRLRGAVSLALLILVAAACQSAGTSPTTAPASSAVATSSAAPSDAPPATVTSAAPSQATTVSVALQEFAIVPSVASAPAGKVTFVAKNTGPDDVHEMVVLRTDLDPAALPVDNDGKADEEGDGIMSIGETGDVAVGATKDVAFDLAPGKYVLICNIVQTEPDGSKEAHYKVGMRTAFTVTAP
jgi:glucose/arabinose dehydrogenase